MNNDWQMTISTAKDRLAELLNRGCFTDVRFAVGEDAEIIQAHKAILSAASPVFATMFFGSLAQTDDQAIKATDIEPSIFTQMLKYIYSDYLKIESCENSFHLCYAAKKYMLNNLRTACIEYLQNELQPENALKVLHIANFFKEENLKDKTLMIIRDQTISVLNSEDFKSIEMELMITILEQNDLQTTELELFQALEILALSKEIFIKSNDDKTKKKLRKQFREAVRKIQFHTMTAEQFSCGPAFSKLLLSEEVVAINACLNRPSLTKTLYPKGFAQNLRKPKILPHVFFDIDVDGVSIGQFVVQLRSDVVPKTVEKFLSFCGSDNKICFKGSIFSRFSSATCCFEAINSEPESHTSELIDNENMILENLQPAAIGLVISAANEKKSHCIFYISFERKTNVGNVIIGQVIKGLDVVKIIESYMTESLEPSANVMIKNCGELKNAL